MPDPKRIIPVDRDDEGGGGGGATTFLDLTDTPSAYGAGSAGKVVIVRSTSNGLEFSTFPFITTNFTPTGQSTPNSDVVAGQPVYSISDTEVELAIADDANRATVVGFTIEAVLSGTPVHLVNSGFLIRANWTAVTGSAALVPGDRYFLSPTTAGMITNTVPTTSGQYIAPLGKALTETVLSINLEAKTRRT
jgi:hypothetical protein